MTGALCSGERRMRRQYVAVAVKQQVLHSAADKRSHSGEVAALKAVHTKLQKCPGPHHIVEYMDSYRLPLSKPGPDAAFIVTRSATYHQAYCFPVKQFGRIIM